MSKKLVAQKNLRRDNGLQARLKLKDTYFRKKMGAFSPPSRLLDLLERFFDTVGLGEERVSDGIGLVMLYGNCNGNAVVVGVRICCMLGFKLKVL